MRFVYELSDKTEKTLKNQELLASPVHVVLLYSFEMYRGWFVKNELSLVGFFPDKMETCKESVVCNEGRGDFVHYCFNEIGKVHQRKRLCPLNIVL